MMVWFKPLVFMFKKRKRKLLEMQFHWEFERHNYFLGQTVLNHVCTNDNLLYKIL